MRETVKPTPQHGVWHPPLPLTDRVKIDFAGIEAELGAFVAKLGPENKQTASAPAGREKVFAARKAVEDAARKSVNALERLKRLFNANAEGLQFQSGKANAVVFREICREMESRDSNELIGHGIHSGLEEHFSVAFKVYNLWNQPPALIETDMREHTGVGERGDPLWSYNKT